MAATSADAAVAAVAAAVAVVAEVAHVEVAAAVSVPTAVVVTVAVAADFTASVCTAVFAVADRVCGLAKWAGRTAPRCSLLLVVRSCLRFRWGWQFSHSMQLAVTRSRAAALGTVTRHYYVDIRS